MGKTRTRWRTAGLYLRAFREARDYWPYLGLVLALGLAGTPLALMTPLPLKIVVDNVLGGDTLPAFLAWAVPAGLSGSTEAMLAVAIAIAVVAALLGAAHQALDWLVREYVAERMVLDFRSKLFMHTLHGSALTHSERGSHEPAYRINLDAPSLQWTALYGVIPVVVSIVSLSAMLYVTSLVAPTLALVALATAVPMVLLIHLNQHRMRDQWHGVRENESAAQSVVQEALGGLRVVTVFGQERFELQRFVNRARDALSNRVRVIFLEGTFTLLLGLTTTVGTVAILYLGVRDVQAGEMTVGTLILVMGYIAQLYAPIQAIGTHITGQQRAVAAAERAFAVLDEEPQVKDRPDARPLGRAAGEMVLQDVGFSYPGTEAPVFSDVSLRIRKGMRVGVVGRSGAGKSTLINLLIRLFDPDRGSIRLDGVDLRDYRLSDLRRQFAVVSQEVMLFSGTVAENIAYGRDDAGADAIRAAARMSDAEGFIEALPDGYDTRVGDHGMRLSGGERQRIALARAFLKDAPILLLDEPTSALDRHTEAAITDSLERLMNGRTVFIITHRESILRDVDLVLHVGGGRITVEEPAAGSALRWAS